MLRNTAKVRAPLVALDHCDKMHCARTLDFTRIRLNHDAPQHCQGTRCGLWVLQSGQHKETRYKNGKLVRRSPYLIVDEGMNEGVITFFEVLLVGRNPHWAVGYVDGGKKPMPNTGIRLLLYPNHQATSTTTLRWKNCGKGENNVNFFEPVVKILQAAGAMRSGGSYSMGSLRTGKAHSLAQAGFPDSIRTAILGHTRALSERCAKVDTQLKAYSRELLVTIEEQPKAAMFFAYPDRFDWPTPVEPELRNFFLNRFKRDQDA